MTGLPMLTLWQPWASLTALGVKHIETRPPTFPAPKSLIGQRMGIHAAKRWPHGGRIGDYYVEPWSQQRADAHGARASATG